MGTRAAQTVVLALALVLLLPCQAAAKWTQVKTEHFLFIGDASERQIRQVAQRLEQFREVMSRVLPAASVASRQPTIVFVFQSDRSLSPYTPRFEGRSIDLGGYFLARNDANYVALNAEREQSAFGIIFHEYAHFLVRNTAGDVPLWVNEGLAGVYETFEEQDGGRGAVIGAPHRERLALLRASTLMPLAELMAVDHNSSVYNEGSRRGLFYAQSWALMHYLMLGNQHRTSQWRVYLAQVKDGATPEEAFTEAFKDDGRALERELGEYIRNLTFPVLRVSFDEKVTGGTVGRGAAMDDAEALAYLGDLLSMLDRVDEARERLSGLVAANPTSVRALNALAMLELKESNVTGALALLDRAAALAPADSDVQRAWGRTLHARWQELARSDDEAAKMTLRRARTALTRATELRPDDAETLAMLGNLESSAGEDRRATELFDRAVSAAPGEERYQLMLADALVRQGDYSRATAYLGPLVALSQDSRLVESARDLLTFVAGQRGRSQPAVADDDLPRGSVAPAQTSAARPTATDGRFLPEFRPVGAGERRVLGTFTEVTCGGGPAVLVVEADGETIRLVADDLATVEFITYGVGGGTVGCGPLNPAPRVFATFRDGVAGPAVGAMDGRAIAIELLPPEFVPR